MKLFLLAALALLCTSAMSQKVDNEKYKVSMLDFPRLSAKDFRTINFKIYNPFSPINQDSLRGYSGTMGLLNGGDLHLGKFNGKTIYRVSMVNDKADVNIEVAFERPSAIELKAIKGKRDWAGKLQDAWYYNITHKFPVAVRITDKAGVLLDAWILAPDNMLNYGLENITQRISDKNKETFIINSNVFTNENELKANYLNFGKNYVEREAMLLQLKKVIETVHDRIYFYENIDKFFIASGKGDKNDYTELDNARDGAIKAIEAKRFSELSTYIPIWKRYIDMANKDKKSMINNEIKAGLLGNLALAYMYREEYIFALDYADAYYGQAQYNDEKAGMRGNLSATGKAIEQATTVRDLIQNRAAAKKFNSSLSLPSTLYEGISLKKEIGRKDKNAKYNLFSTGDNYASIVTQVNSKKSIAKSARGSSTVKTEISKINPFENSIKSMMGSKKKVLIISPFDFPDLNNQPMPKEITELENIGQIQAASVGFTSIPASISKLKDLKVLILTGNQLTSLPATIGELTELETLDLKNNNLTTLPESIKNCTKLKKLNLKGNSISDSERVKIEGWLPGVKIK